jgi:hypothetical protein
MVADVGLAALSWIQFDDPFPSLIAVPGGRLPWKDKSFKKTLQAQVSIVTYGCSSGACACGLSWRNRSNMSSAISLPSSPLHGQVVLPGAAT